MDKTKPLKSRILFVFVALGVLILIIPSCVANQPRILDEPSKNPNSSYLENSELKNGEGDNSGTDLNDFNQSTDVEDTSSVTILKIFQNQRSTWSLTSTVSALFTQGTNFANLTATALYLPPARTITPSPIPPTLTPSPDLTREAIYGQPATMTYRASCGIGHLPILVVCTAPACGTGEVLYCPAGCTCPGGCGVRCGTPVP